MDPRVRDVLRSAHFEAHPQPFVIAGVAAAHDATVASLGPWAAAMQLGDEVTFYMPEAEWDRVAPRYPTAEVLRGWRLIAMQARIPWDLHGVLAALTGALAQRGIPCAALSTYHSDALLVPGARLEEALQALRALRA